MNKIIELNASDLVEFEKSSICVVDFWAEWCQPCLSFKKTFIQVANEMSPKVTFFTLDIDNNQTFAQNHSVRSIPTIILFKNGKEENRHVGSMNAQDLQKWILENN